MTGTTTFLHRNAYLRSVHKASNLLLLSHRLDKQHKRRSGFSTPKKEQSPTKKVFSLLIDGLNASASVDPIKLTPPSGGADIVLFGAVHAELKSSHPAEFILTHRPRAVVVETALDEMHGIATGTSVTVEDCLMFSRNSDPRTMAFAQYGAQLGSFPSPESSDLWYDMRDNIVSEQLAYIAAFAVGAEVIFGDRTKLLTYLRMLNCPSLADLDAAFGLQSLINYAQMVPELAPTAKDLARSAVNITERVLMQERDAVLLKSLHDASLKLGTGETVVGIVGASHVPGMCQLWADQNSWRDVIQDHQVLTVPSAPSAEPPSAAGVRRALFDGVIRLTCRPDVQMDIQRVLKPVSQDAKEAYDLTHELYGTSRMLLAVLDKEALGKVCCGWRCDMWEVLQPLRDVRPVNGGLGYDRELVLDLRTLNFEIG